MLVYILSLCFLFFLLPGCDSPGPAEKAGERIDETVQMQKGQFEEAEKKIAAAKSEIEMLKNELTQARQERDEAKVRLEKAELERQRILREMEPSNINESQENTPLEQQQNGNGPQGQEGMVPQSENLDNGQQPAKENTSEYSEEEAKEHAREALKMNPKLSLEGLRKGYYSHYKDPSHPERFLSALRKAGLPEKHPLPLPDKPSIAVLPFDNMSDDPKQDFFSDGITEEIISALSRVSGLFVIARNSTFTYKGKSVWVPDVARDLGVQYVLEGSVRRAGDRVRITAQLIDGKTNNHIWSETYDRELKDIFAVQDDITMKILTKVKVKLTGGEDLIHPSAVRATNLQAYLKILEGIAHFNESRNSEARKAFGEALSLDPKSPAYGWMAWTYMMDIWFGPAAGRAEAFGKAFEYAGKCLEQDDTNEGCHRTMGSVYTMMRDYEKALYHGRRSVELNPNSANSATILAFILRCAGEYDQAVRECERAMRLDPKDIGFPLYQLGTTYVMMGRNEEAVEALRKSLGMHPRNMPGWVALTMAYSSLDRMEDARAAATEVLKLSPNFSVEPFAKSMPYKDPETAKSMADALRKAGMK